MSEIKLRNVSLEYTIYDAAQRSLKTKVFNFSIGGRISKDAKGNPSIIALRNINLDIEEGDRVALIGHNGAGKSTLLRVLSGVYVPTVGEVMVTGKVSTLFRVDLGFDPSATGYENIMLRGLILGFRRNEIEQHIDKIIEFSQLGQFLNLPVHTYSSGMRLRLAFAISTNINPDVFLLDEWINVGDAEFRASAEKKLLKVVDQSNILVLATHSLRMASKLCNKAVLLSHGKVVEYGPVDNVIKHYEN